MDPNDDSVTGTAKYLVYRKRKQIEFYKDMALIQYAADKELDPSDVVNKLTEDTFPNDPTEQAIKDLMSKRSVEEESKKTFKITKDESGALRLRIE